MKRSTFLLVGILFCATGCEQMLEETVAHIKVSAEDETQTELREQVTAYVDELAGKCPIKINDYTTLAYIKFIGVNRIKYHFVVSESGREDIHMFNSNEIRSEKIEQIIDTPLAVGIVDLDLGVDHIYKDTDGLQLLSYQITKNELGEIQMRRAEEKAEEEKDKSWLPAMFTGAPTVEDNPAGIQLNPYVK